jgi:putative peptide zinc metalloprotease protein
MNLTRVLNVALPDIPARTLSQRPPRIPTDAISKEHIEDGIPIVRVFVPSQDMMYKFPAHHWALAQYFNGQHSYEEIAELYSAETGARYSGDDVREFAAPLEAMNFWYKTPQEKNIELMQKSADERRKLLKSRKSKFGDLSEIAFPAINPDKFITWVYGYSSWVYSWWFTLATLIAFAITAAISITHWPEIGRDTAEFFNFTNQSWGDFGIFYFLALITLVWHELGHAHACKHYGGRVPAMGFLLIYLTPAFYTDTSEGFVKASRVQRLIIAMAGAWAELLICAVATPIWWGTAPGTDIHNAAYLLMLMTGIAGVLINWNPLMKLDGYHMLCEIIGIADLKETSTAYVAAWVKRNIWGLPVEVPYVPKRRRAGFAIYALLSGAYSYTVLYVVARFVGNIFRNFNPDWSFIPELATAGLIFKSRIRTLVNFMKFVYLDKKDRIRSWFGPKQIGVTVVAALVVLFVPIWHESALGYFALEPVHRSIVRNVVPGTVEDVYAKEGMQVVAGAPLVRLRNVHLQSKLAATNAELKMVSMRAADASLRYGNLGPILHERDALTQKNRELETEAASLELRSPISGVVLTPRVSDRLGAYVLEGTALVDVADLSRMRARVFISEHDIERIASGARARLTIGGMARKWDAQVISITPVASEMDLELSGQVKFSGLHPPSAYLVDLEIPNPDGRLKPGMTGSARIYEQRRSIAGFLWIDVRRFFSRKLW